jgi:hypothetical protein
LERVPVERKSDVLLTEPPCSAERCHVGECYSLVEGDGVFSGRTVATFSGEAAGFILTDDGGMGGGGGERAIIKLNFLRDYCRIKPKTKKIGPRTCANRECGKCICVGAVSYCNRRINCVKKGTSVLLLHANKYFPATESAV